MNPPGGVVRVGAGLEPVSASTVNEIVSSVADPLLVAAGFHSTKPRRWIRSFAPIRHILEIVPMKNGEPAGYETFAEGWLQGERAWGRPVDVLVMPDGSMLVSDDYAGAIYKIRYRG